MIIFSMRPGLLLFKSITSKTFTISLFFLLSTAIGAQDFVYGKKFHIHSEILNEEREIWVSLPSDYNDSIYAPAYYPVMYLLDPDYYFLSMTAVREALTGDHYSNMPEMIIVGIVNTDRSRDLTPTNSYIIHSGRKFYESSGGAKDFTGFLTNELIPYIDSAYRTNAYKILNGHSFGGLYALNLLIEQPRTFNAYVVHDPSLWWDDKITYKKALENWSTLNLNRINLFLSKAAADTTEKDRLDHSATIDAFHKNILQNIPGNGLRYEFRFFKEEDHGTVFLPATYSAMKFIYKDYCLPVKKIPFHPEIIEKQTLKVSQNIGFKQIPEEHIIDNIGHYSDRVGEIASAREIFELNLKFYPNSAHACISLANLFEKQNNLTEAIKYYNKAISLSPYYATKYMEVIDSLKNKTQQEYHEF